MDRVAEPLRQMGADIIATAGGRLPLMVRGLSPAVPTAYRLAVASAQVKSAVLFAGLNTPGITRVVERVPTRDHSERMLKGFGAQLTIERDEKGARVLSIRGECDLSPQRLTVPGDPSSAAFLTVAALLVPGSEVRIANVGVNKTRNGLYRVLERMGAAITYENEREVGGEPVADLTVKHSRLTGVDTEAEIAPSMIDEYPILFVAAAMAKGRSQFRGLAELRVKESDRIAAMAAGLKAMGASVEERADGMIVEGRDGDPMSGGCAIKTHMDHRVAMSFAVAGLVARQAVHIDDVGSVATSYPQFFDQLHALQSGTI